FFIKVFGGLYLLFLAYKAFKSAASPGDIKAQKLAGPETSPIGNALRGYVIQMTNPKAALVWIAIISLGLKQGAPMWGGAAIVIGTFILSVVFHLIYAVAFTTPVMVRVYGRARHYIQATLGAFFAFVGIKLLSSEV
ncbi:MAG: amino acid exporter, partial [Paracoccaceae bacterium]